MTQHTMEAQPGMIERGLNWLNDKRESVAAGAGAAVVAGVLLVATVGGEALPENCKPPIPGCVEDSPMDDCSTTTTTESTPEPDPECEPVVTTTTAPTTSTTEGTTSTTEATTTTAPTTTLVVTTTSTTMSIPTTTISVPVTTAPPAEAIPPEPSDTE